MNNSSKYNPPIKSRSTEELIMIANSNENDWQTDAINEAKNELKFRQINLHQQNQFLNELDNLSKKELKDRAKEDFTLFEKIFIVIQWLKELFYDWNLKSEGYILKANRRLQLILLGICLTLLLFIWALLQSGVDEKKRLDEFDKVDISEWENNRILDEEQDTIQ